MTIELERLGVELRPKMTGKDFLEKTLAAANTERGPPYPLQEVRLSYLHRGVMFHALIDDFPSMSKNFQRALVGLDWEIAKYFREEENKS